MVFDCSQIRIPTEQKGTVARIRFLILLLDIITVVFLCLAIGLSTCWAEKQYYYWLNWNDPLVFGVVGISLIWTGFLHVRPAFRKTPLHPGYLVAWELVCWFFILGCAVPALLLSPILNIEGVFWGYSYGDDDCSYGLTELSHNSRDCPRMAVLTMLEFFALSIPLIISILHFIVFIFACRKCERYNKQKVCRNCESQDNQKTIMHPMDSTTSLNQMDNPREEV